MKLPWCRRLQIAWRWFHGRCVLCNRFVVQTYPTVPYEEFGLCRSCGKAMRHGTGYGMDPATFDRVMRKKP